MPNQPKGVRMPIASRKVIGKCRCGCGKDVYETTYQTPRGEGRKPGRNTVRSGYVKGHAGLSDPNLLVDASLLADFLQDYKDARGLSWRELGWRCGMTKSDIANIRYQRRITKRKAAKILNALSPTTTFPRTPSPAERDFTRRRELRDERASYRTLSPQNAILKSLFRKPRAWMEHAACKDIDDPDAFFVERGGQYSDEVKALCASCPVRQECLNYANTPPRERFGVWAGLNETARRPGRVQEESA